MDYKEYLNELLSYKVLIKSKKEVTLFHGSPKYYKILKPVGINFGNRLEDPSWSIFCFSDFESAKNWAAFRALMIEHRRVMAKTGEKIIKHLSFDSINNIGTVRDDTFEDARNIVIGNKKIPFYVYEFKIPINELGLGNDSTHDEYTVNKEIKKFKLHKFVLTKNNLEQFILPKSAEETERMENYQRKHAHRGLITLLYNRDFSKQNKEMIVDIFKEKKIMPGEDIYDWMKKNNYSFNKTLRIPGYGYLNETLE